MTSFKRNVYILTKRICFILRKKQSMIESFSLRSENRFTIVIQKRGQITEIVMLAGTKTGMSETKMLFTVATVLLQARNPQDAFQECKK